MRNEEETELNVKGIKKWEWKILAELKHRDERQKTAEKEKQSVIVIKEDHFLDDLVIFILSAN